MKKISRFSFSDGFLRAKTEQNPNMSTYGWQTKDVVTRPMGADGQWKCAIFHSIAHVDMFCPRQLVSAHVIPTVGFPGFPAIWIDLVNDPISIVLQNVPNLQACTAACNV